MTTLTDKRCRSSWQVLQNKLCNIYDRAFPNEAPMGSAFWKQSEDAVTNFAQAIKKRPITELELKQAAKVCMTKFIDACVKHRG